MSDQKFFSYALAREVHYEEISRAVRAQERPYYYMSLSGSDIDIVMDAVNQGIDSHLEACYVPDRGDLYVFDTETINDSVTGKAVLVTPRLECHVSPESLPILLRRLAETADDMVDEDDSSNIESFVGDVLSTLNIV